MRPNKQVSEPLWTIGRFVNTRDIEAGTDALTEPAQLAGWAAGHGLARGDGHFSVADLERARVVREGLRALLVANNGSQVAEDLAAVEKLDGVADTIAIQARFCDGRPAGLITRSSRPGEVLIGGLLAIVATAVADSSWQRLKVCRRRDCRWAFYDSSKNRSGKWCSMAVCGNASKQRAYVARRRQAQTSSSRTHPPA